MSKPNKTTFHPLGSSRPGKEMADGGFEGASRTSQELALWDTPNLSADMDILADKDLLDARSIDMVKNDAYVMGGINVHRDSIVGSQYLLNLKPNHEMLGLSPEWAEEFQKVTEAEWAMYAEGPECWIDASRKNTFTGLLRLGIASWGMTGEILATAEWIKGGGRPFNTAIQAIDPSRLSNPDFQMDSRFLRRGLHLDKYGATTDFSIRTTHPGDYLLDMSTGFGDWRTIPATKPWGRVQVIHILEQMRPAQSRGVAAMVSALKEMKMTKKFRDVTLQNAVVNATFAAIMESDLPPQAVYEMMNGAGTDTQSYITSYLSGLNDYYGEKGIRIDGVRIAHSYPGTKLKLQQAGTPGGVGTQFEQSLLRYIAAILGVSYEQLSKDYSNTNYSSAKAAVAESEKYFAGKKKGIVDREATLIFRLWFEEALNKGILPIPKGAPFWYKNGTLDYRVFDAYANSTWIGASKGQIDELKETQAAVLRLKYKLTTHENEIARFGTDFRQVFNQIAREQKIMEDLGIESPFNQANNMENALSADTSAPESGSSGAGSKDEGNQ